MAAVIGRVFAGVFIDRLNRRPVSSMNFLVRATAFAAMIAVPTPRVLYIACIGFGLGVGNMISLPPLEASACHESGLGLS
jgi:hypothetical protein